MATTKPTKVPRWNDTGGNRTEPLEAEKDAGWAVDAQPPSSYFNWLQFYTGDWLRWIDERIFDGTTVLDLKVKAIDGTSGDAGDIDIIGGFAASGGGGAASLTGGEGQGGNGGAASVLGGQGVGYSGGSITVRGGSAITGSNLSGGSITLQTGGGTGNAYASMSFKVTEPGTSGTGTRLPVTVLELDAQNRKAVHSRRVEIVEDFSTAGSLYLTPRTVKPSSNLQGNLYDDLNSGLAYNDGNRFHNLAPLVFNLTAPGVDSTSPGSGHPVYLDLKNSGGSVPVGYQIPANTLRVGSRIEVDATFDHGSNTDTAGIGVAMWSSVSAPNGSLYLRLADTGGHFIDKEFLRGLTIVTAIGGAGTAAFYNSSVFLADRTVAALGTYAGTTVFSSVVAAGIDTTVANIIYPYVLFQAAASSGDTVKCTQFVVNIT